MVEANEAVLRERAALLQRLLAELAIAAELVRVEGQVGGGTLPLAHPISWACALAGAPEPLLDRLRLGEPAVLARIDEGRVVLDVRCLPDGALPEVARAVAAALAVPGA